MRYAVARYKRDQEELAYRFYVTDGLYYAVGLDKRYRDICKPRKMDPRSGDEIAMDVINRLGLKME